MGEEDGVAEIAINGVRKVYLDGTVAVANVDLTIEDGQFAVLVGPSGCGKTTLLRMIAGLERITDGEISIGGKVINDIPPSQRDIAMVFQSYALYPHMTVYDNMAFALRRRKVPKDRVDAAVNEAASVLGITDQLRKKPRALSGGQRQRVAMGRAIVRHPQAFLMDEPLSNLDAKLRGHMRTEIARIQRDLGVTTAYVTHDQTEAMTLGDVVAAMNHGVIQQLGPPQVLFDRPANLFVAAFMGSPTMNLVQTRLVAENDELTVALGSQRLRLTRSVSSERPALADYVGRTVALGIRPEDLVAEEPDTASASDGCLELPVELRETLGRTVELHLVADAHPVVTDDTREAAEDDSLDVNAARCRLIATAPAHIRVQEGDRVRLRPDVERMHFFDLETGLAIAERGRDKVPPAPIAVRA
jgi:multiple sugar transport system ATP-binding protein